MSVLHDVDILAIQWDEAKNEHRVMPPEVIDFVAKHGEEPLKEALKRVRISSGFYHGNELQDLRNKTRDKIKRWLRTHNPYSLATAIFIRDLVKEDNIPRTVVRDTVPKSKLYADERLNWSPEYRDYLRYIEFGREPKTMGQFFFDKYCQGVTMDRLVSWCGLKRQTLAKIMLKAKPRYTVIVHETVPIPLIAKIDQARAMRTGHLVANGKISYQKAHDMGRDLLKQLNIYNANLRVIRRARFGNVAAVKIAIKPGFVED